MGFYKLHILVLSFFCICISASDSVDVYCYGEHKGTQGVYWKNSILIKPVGVRYSITKMTFYENSIYYICNNSVSKGNVKYWKNDTVIGLKSKNLATTTDIYVDSNRVIICGWERDSITHPGLACFWINGQKHSLSNSYSYATAITTLGEDIYIAGMENECPCIWKNGNKINLPCAKGNPGTPDTLAGVSWIGVKDSNLIVGGFDNIQVSDVLLSCAWLMEDSVKTYLLDGQGITSLKQDPYHGITPVAFSIDNNNVYTFGSTYSNYSRSSYVVKNGKSIPFTDSSNDTIMIAAGDVLNEMIYIGGSYRLDGIDQLCYWINETRYKIEGSTSAFKINGIKAVTRISSSIQNHTKFYSSESINFKFLKVCDHLYFCFENIPSYTNFEMVLVNPLGRTLFSYKGRIDNSRFIELSTKATATGIHYIFLKTNGNTISVKKIML